MVIRVKIQGKDHKNQHRALTAENEAQSKPEVKQ